MLKNDYNLGGEQSGHIILLDYNPTGDGILTSLMLIQILLEENSKPSELCKIINKYPRKIKFSVEHEIKFMIQFKYHDYSINLDLEAKYIDSPQIIMNVSYSVCDKIFMMFSIINAGNIYSRFEVRKLDILINEFNL